MWNDKERNEATARSRREAEIKRSDRSLEKADLERLPQPSYKKTFYPAIDDAAYEHELMENWRLINTPNRKKEM